MQRQQADEWLSAAVRGTREWEVTIQSVLFEDDENTLVPETATVQHCEYTKLSTVKCIILGWVFGAAVKSLLSVSTSTCTVLSCGSFASHSGSH